MPNLNRFRADPQLIRVSIQRQLADDKFYIVISSREDPKKFVQKNNIPFDGILDAIQGLLEAARNQIPGIDVEKNCT